MKFFFKQMLKISVFYLIKQKSFIPKKYDLGGSQYQNKKALFTDPIFSNGFGGPSIFKPEGKPSVHFYLERHGVIEYKTYLVLSVDFAENIGTYRPCASSQ